MKSLLVVALAAFMLGLLAISSYGQQPGQPARYEMAVRNSQTGRWVADVPVWVGPESVMSKAEVTVAAGQRPLGQRTFLWVTVPSGHEYVKAIVWRKAPPRPWCVAAMVRYYARDGQRTGFEWIAYEDNFVEWEVRPQGSTAEYQFPQCY